MFKLFPRHNRKPLSFPALEASGLEDRFLQRICRFSQAGGTLLVLNSDHNPSVIPLSPWDTIVFLAANGNTTVGQLIRGTARQYRRQQDVPENLDKVILDIIERMLKDFRIVELSDSPVELGYYLSMSIDKQDEYKADAQRRKDGSED